MFPDDPIWTEPVRGSYPGVELIALPGIERLGARENAVIPRPPIHHLFGLEPKESGEGWASFTMPSSPWLQTTPGVFFAGVSALANDAPLGSAILSTVPPGTFGVTSELSMNFLAPATVESGTLTARATLIAGGRTLGLSQATVSDAEGRVLSHSTSRYFLQHVEPPPRVEMPAYEDVAYPTPDPHRRPVPPELVLPRDAWENLSGLDLLRAAVKGEIPPAPFARLFGMSVTEAEMGRFTICMPAHGWLTSPARTIYGGIIAYVADAVMTGAVTTTLPAGNAAATLDLKVQFLRPGIADGRDLIARAEVVHRGRSLAVTRAEILNADGKQIALATGSSMIVARPWASVTVADEPSSSDD